MELKHALSFILGGFSFSVAYVLLKLIWVLLEKDDVGLDPEITVGTRLETVELILSDFLKTSPENGSISFAYTLVLELEKELCE